MASTSLQACKSDQQLGIELHLESIVTYFSTGFTRLQPQSTTATSTPWKSALAIRCSRPRRQLLPPPMPSLSVASSLRVVYIASVAHSCISSGVLLTKRDLYYMCRPLFPTMQSVDRALDQLVQALHVPRNDIHIVAAPKGIVAGPLSFVDEAGCHVDVNLFGSDGCLIPARPERMTHVVMDAAAILVLEKETAFYSLLSEAAAKRYFESVIVVTGKGYPDKGTREFLRVLATCWTDTKPPVPMYILTDADPHGLCIARCYIQSISARELFWIGVQPSHNGSHFCLDTAAQFPITSREHVLLDSIITDRIDSTCPSALALQTLAVEAVVLKDTKAKFEMEALAAASLDHGPVSGLFHYVATRIHEIATAVADNA